MNVRAVGRPREFDREQALRAALRLFWERGYVATSLDDLLQATAIGRSSFYGTFGSKRAVLLEALTLYTDELRTRMEGAANSQPVAGNAILAVLDIAACSERPRHGCFFLNSVMELVPADEDVSRLARRHLTRIDALLRTLLRRLGYGAVEAGRRSGALMALAAGAIALRKAGEPAARIRALLDLAAVLVEPSR